jgi:cell pole-organizing protein PopZ
MSRLESNTEPSMEEILASIRKIIAEDSSGLRSPSSPPRPGTPFSSSARTSTSPLPSPTPAPQRGFMSREAFLKSSQPVEPEPEVRETYVPSNPPRSANADAGSRSSPASLRQREETLVAGAPKVQAGEPARALTPEPAKTPRDGSVSLEAISVELVEIEADADRTVDTEPAPVVVRPIAETDTSGIEAQLSQLLSEDLNALREGRNKSVIDTVKSAVDTLVTKTDEPLTPVGETPRSDSDASSRSASEGSDPFAFDLGPSPFAPKVEPERPAHTASAAQSPITPFDPQRAIVRPGYGAGSGPSANGLYVSPVVPGATRVEPASAEPAAPSPKPRQSFAVPSVSATLGPSRKLEPLSDAFRPAPPLSFLERHIPAAELAPEPVRAPEPSASAGRERNEAVLQPAPPPALTSSNETGLDRPMEDAVADLLRPLLKTWLTENMPKIVERALRREMSERLLPGQKNPQD